jgi:ferredoxin-type protein NapH
MMRIKASKLRALVIAAVAVIIVVDLVSRTGTGTISVFGYKKIAAVCPLGSIESLLASKTFLPLAVISFLVLLAIAILIGRIFCAWICPIPVMRRWFRRPPKSEESPAADEAEVRRVHAHGVSALSPVKIDTRHWVLGGALLSTAIFGFPVFCLVCPIGLTFGTLAVLWRLLHFNEPSWSLLVFPAMIVLELTVFRKWCRKVCPLGALISLMSALNIFVRPKVDHTTCLRTAKGVDCQLCKEACYEEIDLHHADQSQPLAECTKCRDCSDVCPVHAITFPFFQKKSSSEGVVPVDSVHEEA